MRRLPISTLALLALLLVVHAQLWLGNGGVHAVHLRVQGTAFEVYGRRRASETTFE